MIMDFDLAYLDQEPVLGDQSYNELASYLCREVFTDMSVLPLVFPSNISCFSRGSYKEELARTRELPVPPQPRRSGVLARSDDNLAGTYETLLSSLPLSLTDTGSTLTRHSSYTWLRDTCEEEDTCLLATQLRRRYEEVRSRAMERAGTEDSIAEARQEEEAPAPPEPGLSELLTAEEITEDEGEEDQIDMGKSEETMDGKESCLDDTVDKMSVFKKKEKTSLFQRTIDRLSFKSRKKREKDKTFTVEVSKTDPITANSAKNEIEHEIQKLEESPKILSRQLAPVTPAKSPTPSLLSSPVPAPIMTSTPTSAKYLQSRPINQLDQALKSFKRETAKSRENLSLSRPDLTEAISVFTSKPNTPRVELRKFDRSLRPASASQSSAPPRAASSRWRQAAPPTSSYVDTEWAKLSASMVSLNRAGAGSEVASAGGSSWRETSLTSSNMSLDTSLVTRDTGGGLARADRAMSVNVLSSVDNREDNKDKIPDNQLRHLNPYQKRIQASMDKLNVPSWYKASNIATAPSTPNLRNPSSSSTLPAMSSSWRTASMSTSAGWRRQNTQSSAASTLDRQSCLVTSQRFRSKASTLPASPSAQNNLAPSRLYLGWRSQERLDIGPAYLTSPAQRLASSAVVVHDKPGKDKKVTEDIKEVTEAIIDFCSTPGTGKPGTVKQAWVSNDDDSDNSDNPDDDSGIDRSDDFTHEILNEA